MTEYIKDGYYLIKMNRNQVWEPATLSSFKGKHWWTICGEDGEYEYDDPHEVGKFICGKCDK